MEMEDLDQALLDTVIENEPDSAAAQDYPEEAIHQERVQPLQGQVQHFLKNCKQGVSKVGLV